MSRNDIKPGISFASFSEGISYISKTEIDTEETKSASLESKRSRICFHQANADLIHEMVITFHKNTYIRPHKHLAKSESYMVINGEIDLIFFNDDGKIKERIPMGSYSSTNPFYLRSISAEWHTVLIKSEFATILETTNGPFVNNECVFAEWAPETSDTYGIHTFLKSITK